MPCCGRSVGRPAARDYEGRSLIDTVRVAPCLLGCLIVCTTIRLQVVAVAGTILGGLDNTVHFDASAGRLIGKTGVVGGGQDNEALGNHGVCFGGFSSEALGARHSTVVGGVGNYARGSWSTALGGGRNQVSACVRACVRSPPRPSMHAMIDFVVFAQRVPGNAAPPVRSSFDRFFWFVASTRPGWRQLCWRRRRVPKQSQLSVHVDRGRFTKHGARIPLRCNRTPFVRDGQTLVRPVAQHRQRNVHGHDRQYGGVLCWKHHGKRR